MEARRVSLRRILEMARRRELILAVQRLRDRRDSRFCDRWKILMLTITALFGALCLVGTIGVAEYLHSGSLLLAVGNAPATFAVWAASLLIPPLFFGIWGAPDLGFARCVWANSASGLCHVLFLTAYISPVGYLLHAACFTAANCICLFLFSGRFFGSIVRGEAIGWCSLLILSPVFLDCQPAAHSGAKLASHVVYCAVTLTLAASVAIAAIVQRMLSNLDSRLPAFEPSCAVCGYCLRGIGSGICPECGTRIAEPKTSTEMG